jgi:hypothetical protein
MIEKAAAQELPQHSRRPPRAAGRGASRSAPARPAAAPRGGARPAGRAATRADASGCRPGQRSPRPGPSRGESRRQKGRPAFAVSLPTRHRVCTGSLRRRSNNPDRAALSPRRCRSVDRWPRAPSNAHLAGALVPPPRRPHAARLQRAPQLQPAPVHQQGTSTGCGSSLAGAPEARGGISVRSFQSR